MSIPKAVCFAICDVRIDRPWIPETTILVPNRDFPKADYELMLKDSIDYDFVNDPQVIGKCQAVDFVRETHQFKPGLVYWRGEILQIVMTFIADGKTSMPWFRWTSGHISHSGNTTGSLYEIANIEGETFMFMQHKSGDYSFRFMKPV